MPVLVSVLVALLITIISYFIGAINPAILVSRAVYHQDIREVGSKNPGFTNFKRSFGDKNKVLPWIVLILDMSKGFLVSAIAGCLFIFIVAPYFKGDGIDVSYFWQIACSYAGFIAMIGHSYPIFYGFKGGKGFLVAGGTLYFIDWRVGLICMLTMMVIVLTSHIMSVAAIASGYLAPVLLLAEYIFGLNGIVIPGYFTAPVEWPVIVMVTIAVTFMTYRHKKNIYNLFHHCEKKIYIIGKPKEEKAA